MFFVYFAIIFMIIIGIIRYILWLKIKNSFNKTDDSEEYWYFNEFDAEKFMKYIPSTLNLNEESKKYSNLYNILLIFQIIMIIIEIISLFVYKFTLN